MIGPDLLQFGALGLLAGVLIFVIRRFEDQAKFVQSLAQSSVLEMREITKTSILAQEQHGKAVQQLVDKFCEDIELQHKEHAQILQAINAIECE